MFGYIKPFKPELRICEYEAYKAVYCGLCGQLGKSHGAAARLTLSYDFTFLSMLYFALDESPPEIVQGRCYVNPLKKTAVCREGEALCFSADMAAIMLYYKLLDNIQDERGLRRAAWTMLRPFAAGAYKKASCKRVEGDAAIKCSMQRQRDLEEQNTASIDAASDPTAKAMEQICSMLSPEAGTQRVLARMGYLVGRYVYLCDALDDLEADLKKGAYNAFALHSQLKKTSTLQQRRPVYDAARQALYATIAEVGKAYELLELREFKPILDNIVFRGMRHSVDEILSKKEKIQ